MRIAVLAVQGAFIEHEQMLTSLGAECIELRKKEDLEKDYDALVLPGGESTVQRKLLHELDMFQTIQNMIMNGIPTLATCAGLILLSEEINGEEDVCFGTLPVSVKRNAYGRQLGSFQKEAYLEGIGDFNMTFIRAPYIESVKEGVSVLATVDDKIVAAQYKNQIGMAFHPELGNDTRLHKYFLGLL